MKTCGAKTKSGGRCRKSPMPNGRCRLHGGLSPSGIAAARFKSGRYSKLLPERLVSRYQEACDDGNLTSLREEIALIDARIGELLSRIDTGESGSTWKELQKAYGELSTAIGITDKKKRGLAMVGPINAIGALINRGNSDAATWDEIYEIVHSRRRLVESEHKRLADMHQMITTERALTMVGNIVSIIREHVKDTSQLAAISRDIGALVSAGDREGAS